MAAIPLKRRNPQYNQPTKVPGPASWSVAAITTSSPTPTCPLGGLTRCQIARGGGRGYPCSVCYNQTWLHIYLAIIHLSDLYNWCPLLRCKQIEHRDRSILDIRYRRTPTQTPNATSCTTRFIFLHWKHSNLWCVDQEFDLELRWACSSAEYGAPNLYSIIEKVQSGVPYLVVMQWSSSSKKLKIPYKKVSQVMLFYDIYSYQITLFYWHTLDLVGFGRPSST